MSFDRLQWSRALALMTLPAAGAAADPAFTRQQAELAPEAPAASERPHAPDLADAVSGSYAGGVISDARGSSRSDVRLTVARAGRNVVRVTSDYPRLPAFTIPLTAVMSTIQAAEGKVVFLFDRSKQPPTLHVTVDDAAWFGTKE